MSVDERSALIDLLAQSPEIGDIIPGTHGLRKLRVPLAGRGKRGGGRVIYYLLNESLPVYLLLAYAKNDRDDLSADQKKQLMQFVGTILKRKRT